MPPTLPPPLTRTVFMPMLGNPFRESTPEWLGDDRIDDGQLDTLLLLLGYRKFPEKEWEIPPLLLSFLALVFSMSLADLSGLMENEAGTEVVDDKAEIIPIPPIFCCCFWDSFSYNGFTFFKYFLITSFAVVLIFLTEEAGMFSWSRFLLFSFLNTEENLDKEKYLPFLIC